MYPPSFLSLVLLLVAALNSKRINEADPYPFNIGAGIYDITGPAAEIGMMGYGSFDQDTAGIHFRLRARAFVIQDQQSGRRIAYVNMDTCFVTMMMKKNVIDGLQAMFPGVYDYSNVLMTATHTHSTPGGYSWYTMYDITTVGWKKDNVAVIVQGVVMAIAQAHKNARAGRILFGLGTLAAPQSNINRSPNAYLNNPAQERAQYLYDVPKENFLLRLEGENSTEIGCINWFSVHGTSMNNTNHYISGDNKGYAMYLFEQWKNGPAVQPGNGAFVAAFTNTNEGDVSPNTKGAFCPDGTPCDPVHSVAIFPLMSSTCNGSAELCRGLGPGKTDTESTQIIGQQQADAARTLYQNANSPVASGIDSRHIWVNMENVTVDPQFTGLSAPVRTCHAAIGDSFAAGTTDGCGAFNFEQGSNNTGNPFWNFLTSFISAPDAEQVACHHPKPILLNTGFMHTPTPWSPSTLPLQLMRIGQVFIIAVPSEFTTMAGRRLISTVTKALIANGAPTSIIVKLSGLANGYSQYTTTYEEYQVQRYEGASTLFGPWQLAAYQQLFTQLAKSIMTGTYLPAGTPPVDYTASLIDMKFPVLFDDGPIGQVWTQPNASYRRGDLVTVAFHSANPRNAYRTQGTFLTVDQRQADGSYRAVAWDGNWETKFHWERVLSVRLGESKATITWRIPTATAPGTYRITHYGNKKTLFGKIEEFSGTSNTFTVA